MAVVNGDVVTTMTAASASIITINQAAVGDIDRTRLVAVNAISVKAGEAAVSQMLL